MEVTYMWFLATYSNIKVKVFDFSESEAATELFNYLRFYQSNKEGSKEFDDLIKIYQLLVGEEGVVNV
ncbi:hypothetical protein BSL90_07160 [Listeria monocytogenes]|nr:hypothetical protein [Listeria monocytogenes]EAF2292481.1 hypothetical protein [Listeria monocytogenes]EAH0474611.1 hypothetical protein [Listeria monocytogenes]EAK8400075.1 hypothetical protein [Listeria monocytogenes]EDB8978359.1 hypothetical protein [Listeria monocytogenes]